MSIRVALVHQTRYAYDRPVALSPQVIRLRPAPHCRTPITSYALNIEPRQYFLNWQQDPHGNFLARVVFPERTRSFQMEVALTAELTVINPFDFFLEPEADRYPFRYASWLDSELAPYRLAPQIGPRFAQFLAATSVQQQRTVDFLVGLNRYVHHHVKYLIRLEPGVQTSEETLERGSGSCRDSAWLLVQSLRHLGVAARFVSGYAIQLKPDTKSLDGPSGTDHDFCDLHAWAEAYLPGAGWVGLDPTSGLLTGEGHLPLAATPDPSSAAPLTGATDDCQTTFTVAMRVTRIHEDPRVTSPYTDDQWLRIDRLGHEVDAALDAQDVRLTMGGEPTFVSIDDMDGAEWNTAALGQNKRRLACDLFRRLANRFASGPLLHYGQGKWYPGEQLPRWALGCYWRADGEPIWSDPDLYAPDNDTLNLTGQGHAEIEARRFMHALVARLDVDADHVQAAYEDAWYYLWKERRLPVNVDPLDARLDDPLERERLARIFEQGLGKVVGFALPLMPADRDQGQVRWQSGQWFFRGQRMYLTPGDSPMGLRLPLDSLPWTNERDELQLATRDPFTPLELLPDFSRNGWHGAALRSSSRTGPSSIALQTRHQEATPGDSPTASAATLPRHAPLPSDPKTAIHAAQAKPSLVRTALCVEPRQGTLHVFMPPMARAEDYLDLVAIVEATAAETGLCVRIEGYPPPHDPRLIHFKVTPDPGVIEVNVPPARRWSELVQQTNVLYEEARLARLGTEKFMLDGRHTGTGGGNHLVLGGATPADSPFLRRPDLLRSLLTYWNNRPSLSYVFSGLFVGPTSQAPRVDEARHDSLHELETAFTQLPAADDGTAAPSQPVFPWITDRVLRHLLVDITGNTHRAEFCIDKLFSPDSSTGRLGLVEFRAFEMPPHPRMSLTQQLLVRALVARFAREPYRQQLVRWGTALHDRWLLPHFLAEDLAQVIEELNAAGFALDQTWFASHFEFRFPLIGRVTRRDVQLELRQAIEPWHVLGEEASAGGTARYVDSSVERVQVKVCNLTDSRHVVVCNGRRVPLQPTSTRGEYVAGVRFRAWQPPSCLHPTIGVHAPLVFEVIDAWNELSLGGCAWHVSHPGGLSFETFPVNAYAAETRRAARFVPLAQRGGRCQPGPLEHHHEFPCTLDLRRPVELASLDR